MSAQQHRAIAERERISEVTEYKFHEFANLFPLLEGNEFAELVADIRANSLHERIVLFESKILDGRNRYRACLEGGIEPRFELFYGDNDKALAYVISKNLKRRHLDASQRAMIAARIATLGHGQHQSGKFAALPTQAKAAKMLNVGERSVRSARVVLNEGAPELVAAVDEGKITVSPAATVARLPEEKQREAVADGPKDVVAAARQVVAEVAPRKTKPPLTDAEEERREQRWAATQNLITGILLFDRHKPSDGFEMAAAYDPEVAALRMEKITPDRIRNAISFLGEVATAMEGGDAKPVAVAAPDLTKDQKTTLSSNVATLNNWIKQHKAEGLDITAPTVTAAFMAAIEAIKKTGALDSCAA